MLGIVMSEPAGSGMLCKDIYSSVQGIGGPFHQGKASQSPALGLVLKPLCPCCCNRSAQFPLSKLMATASVLGCLRAIVPTFLA